MRWIEKMNDTFFDCLDELYHRAKFVEDRTTRSPFISETIRDRLMVAMER